MNTFWIILISISIWLMGMVVGHGLKLHKTVVGEIIPFGETNDDGVPVLTVQADISIDELIKHDIVSFRVRK